MRLANGGWQGLGRKSKQQRINPALLSDYKPRGGGSNQKFLWQGSLVKEDIVS